jgi:hypothetical protein
MSKNDTLNGPNLTNGRKSEIIITTAIPNLIFFVFVHNSLFLIYPFLFNVFFRYNADSLNLVIFILKSK